MADLTDPVIVEKTTMKEIANAIRIRSVGDYYIPQSEKGKENGVATLDENGKLVQSQASDYAIDQVTGLQNALDKKQNVITGDSGKLIGIDDNGNVETLTYPSNLNLLDNWYFADPINQRGKTEYTSGYSIDRWKLVNCTISIKDDHILMSSTKAAAIEQYVELRQAGTYTLSVLAKGVPGKKIALQIGKTYVAFHLTGEWEMISYTITVNNESDWKDGYIGLYLTYNDDGGSCEIKASKLELGDTQTIAHQDKDGNWVLNDPPPNKGLELLKCQRYFQTFATQNLRPTKGADFRPVMRTETPTLSTITTSNGITLYTASSDL